MKANKQESWFPTEHHPKRLRSTEEVEPNSWGPAKGPATLMMKPKWEPLGKPVFQPTGGELGVELGAWRERVVDLLERVDEL